MLLPSAKRLQNQTDYDMIGNHSDNERKINNEKDYFCRIDNRYAHDRAQFSDRMQQLR